MFWRRTFMGLGATAATAAGLIAVPASGSPSGTLTATLAIPQAPRSGTLTVSVEVPHDPNSLGIPTVIDYLPVETVHLTSGGTLSVNIPTESTAVRAGTTSAGLAQFDFLARFGDEVAVTTESLPVTPAASTVYARDTSGKTLQFSALHYAPIPSNASPSFCETKLDGTWEKTVRLGQMQDSTDTGSQVQWLYSVGADSNFQVGISITAADGGYTASGNYTVSNSFSGQGGFPAKNGYNWYVDGDMYQVRYAGNYPGCGFLYKTYINKAIGDSFTGTNQPALDPWGRCGNDPNGKAKMNPNGGTYSADHGTAVTYSGVVTLFNLAIGGHTGYTNNIYIGYTNNSNGYEYVCGTAQLPNAPILYSNALDGH